MTPLFKSLLGIGLAGGAGLAIGGYHLFKGKDHKDLLEKFQKENLQILDYWTKDVSKNSESESYAAWTAKEEEYKNEHDQNKKFDGLSIGDSESFESIRKKCKEMLEKPIAETKDLETKVKQWCTIAKTKQ